MNRLLLLIIGISLFTFLSAQWSQDPAIPTVVDSGTNYTGTRIAVTSAGNTYIAWVESNIGMRSTFIQSYNLSGVSIWDTPLSIITTSAFDNPSLTDMFTDQNGNAILAFHTLHNEISNITLYKVSPQGNQLWGETGILLSNDTTAVNINQLPVLAYTTEHITIVAWQRLSGQNTIRCQAISETGSMLWGTSGITIQSPGHYLSGLQIMASTNGSVFLKYYSRPANGAATDNTLYTTKINSAGQSVWANPVCLQSLGGMVVSYDNSLCSDGAGGILIGWEDDRTHVGTLDCYVQHISNAGASLFTVNGIKPGDMPSAIQQKPRVCFEPQTQSAYVIWDLHNIFNPVTWAINLQIFDSAGQKTLGDNGLSFIQPDSVNVYSIAWQKIAAGYLLTYSRSLQTFEDFNKVAAIFVNSEGEPIWTDATVDVATNDSYKFQFHEAVYEDSWMALQWTDFSQQTRTCAMRLNMDGTLGNGYTNPVNLTSEFSDPNDLILSWNLPYSPHPVWGYRIYRNNQQAGQSAGAQNMSFHVINCPEGDWRFTVSAVYTDGMVSEQSNSVNVMVTVPDVHFLSGNFINETDILLQWVFSYTSFPPMGFNVYRNGEFWELVNGADVSDCIIEGITSGEWSFYVRAVWADGYQSTASNTIVINTTDSADNQVLVQEVGLSIFPNPFSKNLTITCYTKEASTLFIFNLKGERVRQMQCRKGHSELAWDGLDANSTPVTPGIYFIRFSDRQDRKTYKIIKL